MHHQRGNALFTCIHKHGAACCPPTNSRVVRRVSRLVPCATRLVPERDHIRAQRVFAIVADAPRGELRALSQRGVAHSEQEPAEVLSEARAEEDAEARLPVLDCLYSAALAVSPVRVHQLLLRPGPARLRHEPPADRALPLEIRYALLRLRGAMDTGPAPVSGISRQPECRKLTTPPCSFLCTPQLRSLRLCRTPQPQDEPRKIVRWNVS